MSGTGDDRTVKQLLDAGTRAELERWFGLPSFEQLAERGEIPAAPEPPEDPEILEVRKRRAAAIAAVDPALLDALRARLEPTVDVRRFRVTIESVVDPDLVRVEVHRARYLADVAEAREVEIPEQLIDDLRDCTPQALLRDLHRPETMFDKALELYDPIAEVRVDVKATVEVAMSTRWSQTMLDVMPSREARGLLRELRELRAQPWTEIKVPRRLTS